MLHSILAVANLLTYNNNKSNLLATGPTVVKFHYSVLQLTAVFSDNLTPYFAGDGTCIFVNGQDKVSSH